MNNLAHYLTFSILCLFQIFVIPSFGNSTIDSLKKELEIADSDTTRLNILDEISWNSKEKDWNLAYETAYRQLKMAIKLSDPDHQIKAHNNLGAIFYHRFQFDSSIFHYLVSLDLNEKIGDRKGTAKVLNNLGIMYKGMGEYNKALEVYSHSLKIKNKLGDFSGVSHTLNNIGNLFEQTGLYSEALKYYLRSLSLKDSIGDVPGMAVSYSNIGILFQSWEKYPRALEYFRRSYKIDSTEGDKFETSASLVNIGNTYMYMGKDSIALGYFRKALNYFHQINYLPILANIYNNIAAIHKKQRDLDSALYYFNKTSSVDKKINDFPGQAVTLLNLSELYLLKKDYQMAASYGDSSYPIIKEFGLRSSQKDLFLLKSLIEKEKENFKAAYYFLNRHNDLRDSLLKMEDGLKIENFQIQKDLEKYEGKLKLLNKEKLNLGERISRQQILIIGISAGFLLLLILFLVIFRMNSQLKRKNDKLILQRGKLAEQKEKLLQKEESILIKNLDLRQKNIELKSGAEERERFIRILAHDLRGPIHNITSLAELLDEENVTIQNEQEKMIKGIKEMGDNLNNMITRLLDVNTIETGQITYNPREIDTGKILDSIVMMHENNLLKKELRLEYQMDHQRMIAFSDPYLLSQVFDNLLSNAIKFSPHGARIIISQFIKNDKVVTVFKDEGPGFKRKELQKLFQKFVKFSATPTGGEKSTGVGLFIVKRYLDIIGGKITVESKEGEGAIFTVLVPISQQPV